MKIHFRVGSLKSTGSTALFRATLEAIEATEKMAEQSVEIFEKVTKENLPTK